jgi:hypothetical protein
VTWLRLLKLVNSAGAYVRQTQETLRGGRTRARRGTVYGRGPGWVAFGPRGSKPPSDWKPPTQQNPRPALQGPSHWAERRRELETNHRPDAERGAEELLATGTTVISTTDGPLHARLVRFWNGTAVLDCELRGQEGSSGRSFSLVDRREFRRDAGACLARELLVRIVGFDRTAHPDRWGPPPPEPKRVRSPGGWTPPPGCKPGWSWVPPGGTVPRLDLMPRWVRTWYRTPVIDRFAHAWMWSRGGWEVIPPPGPAE